MFRTDYCGYNVHNPDRDTIYRPNGRSDYLFLHVTSEMEFIFPGDKVLDAHPGDCILYTPWFPQHYRAKRKFSNSFIHFTCSENEMSGLQIPLNELFHPGDDGKISNLLQHLQEEYLFRQPRRDKMIDLLVHELLIEIERSLYIPTDEPEQSEIYIQLCMFRLTMLKRCSESWDIDKMCSMTNLGRSQFFHYYKSFFYTTPKEDLISARIDKAKHLLSNRDLRIVDVAEQSGFTNIYHFNRYFKRECGMTPGEYRKS